MEHFVINSKVSDALPNDVIAYPVYGMFKIDTNMIMLKFRWWTDTEEKPTVILVIS